MASLADLVDMHAERDVFETPSSTLANSHVSDVVGDDEDEDDVDVDEIDPLPPFTLDEAKLAMERVYDFFVFINPLSNEQVIATFGIMPMMQMLLMAP